MPAAQDPRVIRFLQDLPLLGEDFAAIVQRLRDVVISACPDVAERIMYGGIMFSAGADFGGIFVSKGHVSFEFSQGHAFQDPKKLLEGSGKFRRHLKFRTVSDVDPYTVAFFVRQAIALAREGRSDG